MLSKARANLGPRRAPAPGDGRRPARRPRRERAALIRWRRSAPSEEFSGRRLRPAARPPPHGPRFARSRGRRGDPKNEALAYGVDRVGDADIGQKLHLPGALSRSWRPRRRRSGREVGGEGERKSHDQSAPFGSAGASDRSNCRGWGLWKPARNSDRLPVIVPGHWPRSAPVWTSENNRSRVSILS